MASTVNKIRENAANARTFSGNHLAAILLSKGSPLTVTRRPTPQPGPNELLIEVKSIALNPFDWYMRDSGFSIASYPAIIGSDIAGIVVSAGSLVPSDAPQPGTRVCAFTPSYFMKGAPDYGAFQTHVLAPAATVVPLPPGISFNEASLLPTSVETAWAGWYRLGLARDTAHKPADKKGMLVWGAAGSVGSGVVQSARLMGFVVYATASEKHHQYVKRLGASRVFDYRDEDVVESIVKAATEDGVKLLLGFDAAGQLESCMEILSKLKGQGTAKLAAAVPLPDNIPKMDGVEVKFVEGPWDELERMEHLHFVFSVWLKEKLEKGEFVPSPKVQVVDGGLESIQTGLDELRKGVSGVKLVVEI